MFFPLVELLAVKAGKPVRVTTKSAGNPVENNADARLMAGINKVHELLGISIARGGRIVSRYLIAP